MPSNAALTVNSNPVTSSTSSKFYIPTDDDVMLKLHNSSGTVLATIYSDSACGGNIYSNSIDYSLFSSSGTYYLVLKSSTEQISVTLIKE